MYCLPGWHHPIVRVSLPVILLDARCKPWVGEVPALQIKDYIEGLTVFRFQVRFPIEQLSEDIIKAGEWVLFGAKLEVASPFPTKGCVLRVHEVICT
jgi:hypothetical protein